MKWKRLVSLLLVMALCLGITPFSALAENYKTGETTSDSEDAGAETASELPEVGSVLSTKQGLLSITVSANSGDASGYLFDIIGLSADGEGYIKHLKTDISGEILCHIPDGIYTVSLNESSAENDGVSVPEPQSVTISEGNTVSIDFKLEVTRRQLQIAVVDKEGLPLADAVVGVFDMESVEAQLSMKQEAYSTEFGATHVLKEMLLREQEAQLKKRKENPFGKQYSIDTAASNKDGIASFSKIPTKELVVVVINAPAGYAVTGETVSIPAGWEEEFSITCPFITADVSFIGEITQKPVTGAVATLVDEQGDKIVDWKVKNLPHRLICIPAGEYGIRLSYGGEEESFSMEINTQGEAQSFNFESRLSGSVQIEETVVEKEQELQEEKNTAFQRRVALIAVLSAAAIIVLLIAIMLWRRWRKQSGGYQ